LPQIRDLKVKQGQYGCRGSIKMKRVVWLKPEQMSQWDVFVEKHPLGLIYHLSAWKQVLEKSFSHIRGYFLAIEDDESGEILGGIPIYLVKSWHTDNRLVSNHFATLCDPLISTPSDLELIWPALANLYEKIGAHYIELRARCFDSFENDSMFAVCSQYKHHYLVLDSDPQELMRRFRSNCRNHIRKALKNQIVTKMAQNENDLLNFFRFYLKTRKRLGLPPIPYKFFQNLWEVFSNDRLTLVLATSEGKNMGAHLILKFKGLAISEAIGDRIEFRKLGTNYSLYWQGIKLACREGYRTFSFGRTSVQNQGLLSFKRGWGTVEETLSDGFYPREISQEMERKESSWKYRAVKTIAEGAPNYFFPLFGKFVYRHMG